MFIGSVLVFSFYLSLILSLLLFIAGIVKKSINLIILAAFLGVLASILSLWSIWKFVVLIPIACVIVILGFKNKFNRNQWFFVSLGGSIAWLILFLI
ncbi:hypothetical protein ACTHO0_26465 [Cytobacillus praedii]|uniref:hypothetical protein n=1 Tax=Cytobacillus praedii TaxID=1742358 RepID=UPI003F7F7D74